MRTRAWRRAQRKRLIERRRRNLQALSPRRHVVEGKLAKWNGIGCPDGRSCSICRPFKRPITRQEVRTWSDVIEFLCEPIRRSERQQDFNVRVNV